MAYELRIRDWSSDVCSSDLFHAIRTRTAGSRRFVTLHMLVPGAWSVQRGHDLVEDFELALATRLGPVAVLTHLEPIEDPLSQDDAAPERVAPTTRRDAGAPLTSGTTTTPRQDR